MRFLKVPSLKQATNLALVAPEEEDINIFMLARLFSEKEVNGPAACNPPGDWQRREKLSDLMWLPRLPCSKRRCLPHCPLLILYSTITVNRASQVPSLSREGP